MFFHTQGPPFSNQTLTLRREPWLISAIGSAQVWGFANTVTSFCIAEETCAVSSLAGGRTYFPGHSLRSRMCGITALLSLTPTNAPVALLAITQQRVQAEADTG